jgi:hypothetical protein
MASKYPRPLDIRNLITASLLLVTVGGCSNSINATPDEVVAASGTLLYHGNPVAEAQLTFWNDDLPEPAFALTDALGKFKCMTNETADGMPPGEYLVTVKSAGNRIPEKYARVESSTLHVTVTEESANELSLQLED